MDIEKLDEFAAYCQERADDPQLAEQVAFAERWANLSEAGNAQYGMPMDEAINWATTQSVKLTTHDQLETSQAVLGRFWGYREAFQTWFKSKVIIVGADLPSNHGATSERALQESDGRGAGFSA